MGAAASYQRSSNNEKIASFLGQRQRDGLWQGSAPYGWRFASAAELEAGAPKTLVAIPEQLVGVARATAAGPSGHSLRQVASKLNQKESCGFATTSSPSGGLNEKWTDTRVKLVLRCPAQAGLVKTPEGELIYGCACTACPNIS